MSDTEGQELIFDFFKIRENFEEIKEKFQVLKEEKKKFMVRPYLKRAGIKLRADSFVLDEKIKIFKESILDKSRDLRSDYE